MTLYSENENYKLYQGNMLDMLEAIDSESIDSIVTDPPYELGFMGKSWDGSGVAFQKESWERCYKVLKSGGYLLAFGGSRTFHRIACAIEDAGFEIRDTIMWLYGSGFPKSMNIANAIEGKEKIGSANKKDFKRLDGVKGVSSLGFNKSSAEQGYRPNNYNGRETVVRVNLTTDKAKQWQGWGTALKPAYEPIIVARKPFKGSCVDNVIKYGVGGINIDECRIGDEERTYRGMSSHKPEGAGTFRDDNWQPKDIEITVNGRFPANVVLTYDETDDERLRYFYCAKASKKDRNEGLDGFEEKRTHELQDRKPNSLGSIMADDGYHKGRNNPANPYAGAGMPKKNTHPTVKPTSLMQYLVRLVTPNGGTVLDPFNGSGSTGKAVMYENAERNKRYKYIGIELTEEYLPIAKARIENINVQPKKELTLFEEVV